MIIQRSQERIPSFLRQPRHDLDDLKTPTQQQLEREAGIRNDKTKRIAQEAVQNVYQMMEKVVRNTEFNIRLKIDESGTAEQFELAMKKDGKVIASLPPDSALQIADRAKKMTLGLLFDISV